MQISYNGRRLEVTEGGNEEMLPSAPCTVWISKGKPLSPKGDKLFRYGLWFTNPPWPKPRITLGPVKKVKRYRCADTVDYAGGKS